jgi:aryl-alcohol dehydrogenase-like predicted oxidoreductase
MHLRPFGSTGLNVGAIGMGVMPLSVTRERPTEAEGIAVIHHAIDCGVTLFDTADSYCLDDSKAGHNERVLGRALAELPASAWQNLTVATKGGLVRPGGRWEEHRLISSSLLCASVSP